LQTVAIVSSYPPRKCGIATFAKDLHDAITKGTDVRGLVLAMDDAEEGYPYPPEVRFELQASDLKDYELATDYLNINQIDLVAVQHEFGLFGARAGENILSLVKHTRMPVITTLHTVLDEPSKEQAAVMRELLKQSDRVVVMSRRAKLLLESRYGGTAAKVAIIPHGIPDVPFVDPSFYKDRFGFQGRRVLMTFGLLGPGKGLEVVLDALPAIVQDHPDVLYVIVGAIHPHIEKREGHSYIHSLQRQAARLGVSPNVMFHTRYVSLEELCAYLGAADVFVTPYPNRQQICSGTLTYAMGAGKAVVSTPYFYAEEMLADGRGKLFDFGRKDALAAAVCSLLDHPTDMNAMRKAAYLHCRSYVWSEVGEAYRKLAEEVLEQRTSSPRPMIAPTVALPRARNLPEVRVDHLITMSDDTGLLQHAAYSVPNRWHGYCTDDNARALVAAMLHWELTEEETLMPHAVRYLGFLHHAWDADARQFHNFLRYDRRWDEKDFFSEDALGRSMWGLGLVVASAPTDGLRGLATRLFGDALAGAEQLQSPRGWAFALMGIHAYLRRYSGDAYARRVREALARKLYEAFTAHGTADWPWCEETVTYDNGALARALLQCGRALPEQAILDKGLAVLEWLLKLQTDEHGRLSLIGNQGWYPRGGESAKFDQQPVDAMGLVVACCEAFRATKEPLWWQRATNCFEWFLGRNILNAPLYDSATGGCCDGLNSSGPNQNQGAESTLAWMISLIMLHKVQREANTGVTYDHEITAVQMS
jgi:glycosyltransferase involved in cell wall biosynthesis